MRMAGHVSDAVIRRLPGYYRHLRELESAGVEQISSQELGERMHLTPSQIRQDINCFGGFGRQGYGYKVSDLKMHIGEILGLDREHTEIIVGAGNIGGMVGAVICNHIHIVELFGVFQHFQVFQKVCQHHFFIMGRYHHGKFALWRCQIFFFSMPHAAYSNDRIVNGKKRHDQLYGDHDYIEYVSHYSFPSPFSPAVFLVLFAFRFAFLRFRKVFIMPNMI